MAWVKKRARPYTRVACKAYARGDRLKRCKCEPSAIGTISAYRPSHTITACRCSKSWEIRAIMKIMVHKTAYALTSPQGIPASFFPFFRTKSEMSLHPFDHHGRSAASAIAKSSQAVAATVLLQDIVERDQDPGAGSAEWMAQGYGTTEHIDLRRING